MARFPVMNDVPRISAGGGCQPIWRRDGRELFCLDSGRQLVSVEMPGEAREPLASKLFASRVSVYGGFAQYAVDGTGQQFLMIETDSQPEPPEPAEPIHVMTNWAAKPRY